MDLAAKHEPGKVIVYMKGELDHHAAKGAMDYIESTIDLHLPMQLIVDLSGLSFMDSSGFGVLMAAYRAMRAIGGKVLVQNAPAQAMKVLRATPLDAFMKIL